MPRAEKIPRPPNSFMLYRSDMAPRLPPPPPGKLRSQGEVSQLVAKLWNNEAPAVRAEFERRAAIRKMEHEAKYPDYKYRPRSKAEKEMEREMNASMKPKTRKGVPQDITPASALPPFAFYHSAAGFPSHAYNAYPAPQYPSSFDTSFDTTQQDINTWSQYDFEEALAEVFGNTTSSADFYEVPVPQYGYIQYGGGRGYADVGGPGSSSVDMGDRQAWDAYYALAGRSTAY